MNDIQKLATEIKFPSLSILNALHNDYENTSLTEEIVLGLSDLLAEFSLIKNRDEVSVEKLKHWINVSLEAREKYVGSLLISPETFLTTRSNDEGRTRQISSLTIALKLIRYPIYAIRTLAEIQAGKPCKFGRLSGTHYDFYHLQYYKGFNLSGCCNMIGKLIMEKNHPEKLEPVYPDTL